MDTTDASCTGRTATRRSVLGRGVSLAGAALVLGSFPSCVTPLDTGSSGGARPETLRVLSYNIHMWEISVDDLAKVIQAADADIVGLNEAWDATRNEEIARALGYEIVYGGRASAETGATHAHKINGYYMPQVLLTRHRVICSQVFNAMEAQDHAGFDPEVPIYRGGTMAELETAAGNRLVVFVLHLHPWGGMENEEMTTMRLEEIKGIASKLEPYRDLPILLIGDFNTRSHFDTDRSGKVTPYLVEQGFHDLYRTVHADVAGMPGLTCGDGRIDYIFYNRHAGPIDSRVLEAGVFGSRGYEQSDHLGVFGSVQLNHR